MSEQSGASKNRFSYTPTREGECEIFMASTDTEEVIVFPSEIDGLRVTALAYSACKTCRNVKTIIIPEGVTYIGMFAFWYCSKLEHIHLPSTLEEFDSNALSSYNGISLITCPKKNPLSPEVLADVTLPKSEKPTRIGEDAGKEYEDGTVGLYTVTPTYPDDCVALYEKSLTLTVTRYPKADAEAYLAKAKGYELTMKTVRTYDVYSSDGVSPDDRDESGEELAMEGKNLVVRDGECCGVIYTEKGLCGILFFDGTKAGITTAFVDRTLCYGHPLDYYINTSRSLTLTKK
ncbi:MAG: leucine-rich repeat protein [Clostridia bacterium]|nr:leucine-rich repeat protein [Clostridia bacterium]